MIVATAAAAACAGNTEGVVGPTSWSRAHTGEHYACDNDVLNDQLTTGGLRVTTWTPCWNIDEEARVHQQHRAPRLRVAQQIDPQLERAAAEACASISAREQEHSPFAHRVELVRAEPVRERGELRGVRVVFAKVPGLDAAWLRADIACHQALWRMYGSDPADAVDDPTLVRGARVAVGERGDEVEVVVTSDARGAAEIALERARGGLIAGGD